MVVEFLVLYLLGSFIALTLGLLVYMIWLDVWGSKKSSRKTMSVAPKKAPTKKKGSAREELIEVETDDIIIEDFE